MASNGRLLQLRNKFHHQNNDEKVDKTKSRQHKPKSLVVTCDINSEPQREDEQEDVPATMSYLTEGEKRHHPSRGQHHLEDNQAEKKKHQNETSPISPTSDLPSLTPKASPREGHNQRQGVRSHIKTVGGLQATT
ncbi:hypothetical protein GQ457_08G012980 [Hibiscus cannabinus]